MLSATAVRRLLIAFFVALFGSTAVAELIVWFAADSQVGCMLPLDVSPAWPALRAEVVAVTRLLPHQACAFVLAKSAMILLSAASGLAFLVVVVFNFGIRDVLFWRAPKTFVFLIVSGLLCLLLFRTHAIITLSAAGETPFHLAKSLRTAILAPVACTATMVIGLLGFLIKDGRSGRVNDSSTE